MYVSMFTHFEVLCSKHLNNVTSFQVTETQILRECSKPGELYSVDVDSVNAGIPYADSFMVIMHYCLVR